jgi:HK97 gp10 family phage protein
VIDMEKAMGLVRQAAAEGVRLAAQEVREEAVRLIEQGPKSGRVYIRNGRRHQASAPGQPPARDTRNLQNRISIRHDVPNLRATVNSGASYAAALEFGTAKIEPRPYMRRALANKRDDIQRIIDAKIAEVLA